MIFEDFKNATQRFNVLKRSDVAGSYHFPTATVSFESLERRDIDAIIALRDAWSANVRLSEHDYEAIAKVIPLAVHEYTHCVDSTSTVWGLKFLHQMEAAYSCSDEFQRDEREFWRAKEFHDLLRRIALPKYYTAMGDGDNTLPWRATITVGQLFDHLGRATERPVLFQRFNNAENEHMVRSPISTVSLLEASAMAQETALRMSLIANLEGDYGLVERRDFSRRLMAYLHNPQITEYSVCVHLVANVLDTPDIGIAFVVCGILARACLNLTDQIFDQLLADQELMARVGFPRDHAFSSRLRDGLRSRDLGTAFFLFARRLQKMPDLKLVDAEAMAIQAIAGLGIDAGAIHQNAVAACEELEHGLRGSRIEPIRLLAAAGVQNLRTMNPTARRIDFNDLQLPRALLGDSTEVFLLGDPTCELGRRSIESVFEPLFRGERWVERFSEACV